jgi:hypothetical protein
MWAFGLKIGKIPKVWLNERAEELLRDKTYAVVLPAGSKVTWIVTIPPSVTKKLPFVSKLTAMFPVMVAPLHIRRPSDAALGGTLKVNLAVWNEFWMLVMRTPPPEPVSVDPRGAWHRTWSPTFKCPAHGGAPKMLSAYPCVTLKTCVWFKDVRLEVDKALRLKKLNPPPTIAP